MNQSVDRIALLTALGHDPETHRIWPDAKGIQVVTAETKDPVRYYTLKQLKRKARSQDYLARWNAAYQAAEEAALATLEPQELDPELNAKPLPGAVSE